MIKRHESNSVSFINLIGFILSYYIFISFLIFTLFGLNVNGTIISPSPYKHVCHCIAFLHIFKCLVCKEKRRKKKRISLKLFLHYYLFHTNLWHFYGYLTLIFLFITSFKAEVGEGIIDSKGN